MEILMRMKKKMNELENKPDKTFFLVSSSYSSSSQFNQTFPPYPEEDVRIFFFPSKQEEKGLLVVLARTNWGMKTNKLVLLD